MNEHFRELLERLDTRLAKTNVPVRERVTRIAFAIENALEDSVPGGDLSTATSYAETRARVAHWYRRRFGAGALQSTSSVVDGVLFYHGTARRVEVPLFLHTPGPDLNTVWVHFPARVLRQENPLRWLTDGPRLALIPKLQRPAVRRHIVRAANALRAIRLNLATASGLEQAASRLAETILSHLGQAARSLSSQRNDLTSLALWDLHVAVEKSIKLNLRQHKISYPNTHSSAKLRAIATTAGRYDGGNRRFDRFLTEKETIGHRYAELDLPSASRIAEHYRLALGLVRDYTAALDRRFRARGDARILVRRGA